MHRIYKPDLVCCRCCCCVHDIYFFLLIFACVCVCDQTLDCKPLDDESDTGDERVKLIKRIPRAKDEMLPI